MWWPSRLLSGIGANLQILLMPSIWYQNSAFADMEHDRWLNALLDTCPAPGPLRWPFEADYRVVLGGKSIWVANYPFAYGNTHENFATSGRPTRKTILRLHKYLEERKAEELLHQPITPDR